MHGEHVKEVENKTLLLLTERLIWVCNDLWRVMWEMDSMEVCISSKKKKLWLIKINIICTVLSKSILILHYFLYFSYFRPYKYWKWGQNLNISDVNFDNVNYLLVGTVFCERSRSMNTELGSWFLIDLKSFTSGTIGGTCKKPSDTLVRFLRKF